MPTTLDEIRAADWSISTGEFGQVAEGLADVNQCVYLILNTVKGSDPLRPDFGADVLSFFDQPVNIAGPGISREIVAALSKWETRIRVKKISFAVGSEPQNLIFSIDWVLGKNVLVEGNTEIEFTPGAVTAPTITETEPFINPEAVAIIKTLDWALSVSGFGRIAQGVNEIHQSILLIASTMPGSDPLRPEFGSRIFEFIDTPLPSAKANMVTAIRVAVTRWEPRVKILYIYARFQNQDRQAEGLLAGIVFSIGWRLSTGVEGQTNILLQIGNDAAADIENGIPVEPVFRVLGTEEFDYIVTEMEFEFLEVN